MSVSKVYQAIFLLFFLFSVTGCLKGGGSACSLKSEGYHICIEKGEMSKKWGEYLHKQLSKRSKKKNIVQFKHNGSDCKRIRIEMEPSLPYDYCIENREKEIVLKGKSERTILWLTYQFIKKLSDEDERIDADDIPPAVITFETQCRNFDFEYREPFFSPNLSDADYSGIIGTNNLETDWGIWGHNLGKVLNKKGSDAIYARNGLWIEEEQFCFSNEETFRRIETHVADNYENQPFQRFMIMPNDNTIVCLCDLCKRNGNTEKTATPAVAELLSKLAIAFPQHQFFTSAYLTTENPPRKKLPENTGVMISTIDLPKGIPLENSKKTKDFILKLNGWKEYTPSIYIWDYAANFDDYLTPTPVLYGLKSQLQFYKSLGIKGVFLNASGYDYSSFDDVKTYVAASLLINCRLSVDSLCEQYFRQYYPVSGKILSEYYLSLEKRLQQKNKPYNMYGGFRQSLRTFLDADEFIAFYHLLSQMMQKTEGKEKENLNRLFTVLSYTRLQLAYVRGADLYGMAELKDKTMTVKPQISDMLAGLQSYKNYKNFSRFKEFNGELDEYVMNWKKLLEKMPFQNKLIGEKLKLLSKPDEDYMKDLNLLNDGVLGFYGDYHQGWYLSSTDNLHVEFQTEGVKKSRLLSLRFLIDERHNIHSPEKIEIMKDGKLYKTVISSNPTAESSLRTDVVKTDIQLDLSDCNFLSVKIYKKNKEKYSLACDEIQLK